MTNEEFIESIRLEGEEWRDVAGWENLYMVSSFGRVASMKRFVPSVSGLRTINPKLLSPTPKRNGYLSIILCRGANKRSYALVHRLVAIAFIPNPDNKPMIDHIDRVRTNNNINNLRWCTLSENMQNPSTKEYCSKLNLGRDYPSLYQPVVALKNGVLVKKYNSIKSAVKEGYKSSGISNACAGRDPSYKGYKWMYLSDYESLVNKSKNT
jgi:hypothetical protein